MKSSARIFDEQRQAVVLGPGWRRLDSAAVEIPANLRADLKQRMKSHPSQPWDEALEQVLPSSEDLAESQNEGAPKPS